MSADEDVQRALLPIPDRPCAGPVMYDARDPDATFEPGDDSHEHLITPEDIVHLAMAQQ